MGHGHAPAAGRGGIGHGLYLVFYLVAGVLASFAQILVNTDSVIPTLGASGAIAGVLGAYLVMFPTNRVLVLIIRFPVWVPAIVVIGLWAALQFISGFGALGLEETGGGWQRPRINGTNDIIPVEEIAANMHVNFNFQDDPNGDPRDEVEFAVEALLEYRLGGLDFAVVRLVGRPGRQFGRTSPRSHDQS